MSNRTLPLGIGIIILGIIIVLGKLGFFQTIGALFWPLLVTAAGGVLHLAYWKRSMPSAVLIPGGILLVLSLMLLLCAWLGWSWISTLWPLIPAAAGFGLYQYASAERNSALRQVSLVICGITLLLLIITFAAKINIFVLALLLIISGVIIAARRPRKR